MKVIDFLASVIKGIFIIAFIAIFLSLVLMMVYPQAYTEEILLNSEENNLDPYMVMAIINVESHFDKDAVSGQDARGLMQVQPDTGTWAADTMGLPYQMVEELSKPANNIRIGTWLLRQYLDRYEGNINRALAAYNAGPAVVDQWLTDGVAIDEYNYQGIPYPETRHYIRKVHAQTNTYARINKLFVRAHPIFDFGVEAINEIKGFVKEKVK